MRDLEKYLPIVGRIMIASIFFLSGIGKITNQAAMVGYMETFSVPGFLIWPAIFVELAGALMLIVGWQTRWAAVALAGYTLLTALIFHSNFALPPEVTNFRKNIAITGGLLYVIAYGAGALSLDSRRGSRAGGPTPSGAIFSAGPSKAAPRRQQ